MTDDHTTARTITLGPLVRSGAADAVHRGHTTDGAPVLVTLTMRHDEGYAELARTLELAVDGVTPLVFVGEADPATGFRDVLVEREPAGRPILDRAPLAEAAVVRCGIAAAGVLAAAHARGFVLGGLAPEVIYVDDELRFTALTPRSRRFVASVELRSGGLRSYKLPYSGYEALVLGRPSLEAGDVFALCASLFHAAAGAHPFGAQLPEIFQRITTSSPLRFPGSAALGDVLASGLVADPAQRPTPAQLADALARVG
jgi:hypothetical protein